MASFEELPKAVQDVIRSYEEANGNGERPTFKFAPSEQLGITSPIQGNVYPDAPAPDMGALSQTSQVAPVPQATEPQQAQAPQGALAQAMQNIANFKMPTVQDALNQYMPQDDSRGRYLALAAGLGSVTKTGSFGEQIGNVASAMQQQKQQQEQMRLQYLPHIMQQVAAQQQMAMQMQNRALIGSVLGGGTAGGVASPTAPQGAPAAPQTPTGGIPAVSGIPSVGGAPAQGQPAPQGQPQGSPAPSLPTPQPAAQVTPQAMQQVQAEWQRMGMTYPISQIEAVGILTSPDPTTAFMTLVQKHSEPSAGGMLSIQAGHMPGTPEYLADQQAALLKANNISPTALRPGAMFATGQKHSDGTPIYGFTPAASTPGTVYVPDKTTEAGVRTAPIPGALPAIEASAQATAMGTAGAHPTTVYSGTVPVQSTSAIQARQAQGIAPPPGSPTALAPNVTPVLPPGVDAGATGTQKQMIDKFGELTAQTSQAQTQNSYLTGIADQAKKAIIGPASDKLNYANNLLAQAGFPASADMATAYEVMKKNESQIIARMRTGGLGTDQAQTLLQAAYPNSGMTIDAIDKTSKNLIGANNMIIAKNSVLAPHANALSPVTYSQNETIFNKNADPTLFERYSQYKSLTPGSAAAQAYLGSVLKQDPTFLTRVQNLTKIGAF